MAKRIAQDEKPYSPVDEALVRSVLKGSDNSSPSLFTQNVADNKQETAVETTTLSTNMDNLYIQEEVPIIPTSKISKSTEKLSREKRVLLTKTEEREIERFVDRLADELETPLKLSHILRACMTVLRHSEVEILIQAQKSKKIDRPPNGDLAALAKFENQLAQILVAAFRKASTLKE